jgi:periplasmic divalent cation tolerance protein
MFNSIYVTASSETEAKEIAKSMLEKHLIACANLFPISSYYYWDGKLQEDSEFGMIMKTRAELVDQLIDELKKMHSYDVPCIVSWPIDKGNEEYLSWIENETKVVN